LIVRTGSDISAEDRGLLEEKLQKYKKRALVLRTNMLAKELPEVPGSQISSCAPCDTGKSLNNCETSNISEVSSSFDGFKTASKAINQAVSVCEQAKRIDEDYAVSSTLSVVGSKVGNAAVTAFQTARSIEEEYHVAEKVADSVKSSITTARKIEEDYKVSESVTSAARDAARLAAEYEARYQIRQKVGTLASDSWEAMKSMSAQALEYDRRYHLSERAGVALMEGMSCAADLAREAARGQWTLFSSSKPIEPASSLPPNAQV
jgi:hypothetical protein